MRKKVVIIGAGPAGLTAARELLAKSDFEVAVYDRNTGPGGLSRTENFQGNRIDIGGHRFFSRSPRIMAWWNSLLPLQGRPSRDDIQFGRKVPLSGDPAADPEVIDRVMLVRPRLSHILFSGKFFNYPLSFDLNTLAGLGFYTAARIGGSYAAAKIGRKRQERSLEDFFINRFGKELYSLFFRDYTEKVWGVPCDRIKPEWGTQRIKNVSIARGIVDAVKNSMGIRQKHTETSLIRQFFYPKYGPGQLWSAAAEQICGLGGQVRYNCEACAIDLDKNARVNSVTFRDTTSGKEGKIIADYVFSSMPVKDLIAGMNGPVPLPVKSVASGLHYRDFLTVGILARRTGSAGTLPPVLRDTWIYIQEKGLRLGRVQIFNNWSPYLVKDETALWLGLEYFCQEGDSLWSMSDAALSDMAIDELDKTGIAGRGDVFGSTVLRERKAYPAYTGAYDRLHEVRSFTDAIDNLFLIGRNGMHRYNNMDHSMMSAWKAVEVLLSGSIDKGPIWNVNTDSGYQEENP
jgi:protoporphyrinogen oxidase